MTCLAALCCLPNAKLAFKVPLESRSTLPRSIDLSVTPPCSKKIPVQYSAR